jgi:hypothetical protein
VHHLGGEDLVDEDEQAKYEAVIAQYGQMESHMGTEGYAAFLKTQESMRFAAMAHAERVQASTVAIRITTLMFFLGMIPVIVWLWKWAL